MKITHEDVCIELRGWAAETNQEIVAAEIAQVYQLQGGGPLLGRPDTSNAVHNNKQRIFRWVDADTKAAREKIQRLLPAILIAMPAERRARLTDPKSVNYLTSKALQDVTTAVTALLLGCSEVTQKLTRAVDSIQALLPIAQSLVA
ncbi:toxin YdaT family protein [Serratia aquatilis]|uniref:Toxin YdaT family protein n=1 Tax=Serratia aquatilis TaxID=1737515 RepID=A0ABV6E9G1_9GAMM